MNTLVEFFKSYWMQLSKREHLLIVIGTIVSTLAIITFTWILPQAQLNRSLHNKLNNNLQTVEFMQNSIEELISLHKIYQKRKNINIQQVVNSVLSANKIVNNNIQIVKNNKIIISNEDSNFSRVHRAIYQLENTWGFEVLVADINYISDDKVNFSLTLTLNKI